MGLLPLKHTFIKRKIYNFIFRNIYIVCISKNEKRYLEKVFPKKFISYVPFGVDKEFWSTDSRKKINENLSL